MMKTHTLVGVGLTALLLGGFAAGGVTFAGDRDGAAIEKQADATFDKASKALSKGDGAQAVSFAEAAVALKPQDATYRMLLGQSYLKAGRFVSAHQAFADVLTLNPGDDRAALNLALAEIAEGQWDAARQTLNDHADGIPARDRGLAIALAGDPAGGVQILMTAARSPDADAKTRQNLALALALSGRWSDAKTLVSVDVAPEEANKRILQWITFAKPTSPSDQVAALLGVVVARDDGQPVTLALNAAVPVAVAEATPVEIPAVAEAPVETAAVADAPLEAAAMVAADVPPPTAVHVVFAARHEVVQALPPRAERRTAVAMIRAKGAFKSKVAAVAPPARQPGKGNWYVQLGAFDSAGVAHDAWARATRRYAAFEEFTPNGMAFKASNGDFYRLSVGGFGRADAAAMCRAYRASKGNCFVRVGAGDQIAQWVKPNRTEVASR